MSDDTETSLLDPADEAGEADRAVATRPRPADRDDARAREFVTATTRFVRPGPDSGERDGRWVERESDELAHAATEYAPDDETRLEQAIARLPVVESDRYHLGGELGRGGIGKVVRARDLRLDRPVAVKELLDSPTRGRARFLREALLTARLQHPAIVPVYDAGFWPDGAPFYAMKLVSGRTLGDRLAEADSLAGRLAYLPSVRTVADAIAYAHSRRIIHRDLKPSNVLMGAFGETVVVDWGLAKDLAAVPGLAHGDGGGEDGSDGDRHGDDDGHRDAARRRSREDLTRMGTIMGTPAYMAPEQARGEGVDERADIYAVGAILYRLLTGEAPYRRLSSDEILARLGHDPPDAIRELAPEAPDELVTIVERAMAIEPGDRYPGARELAEDLARFQTGQLVSVHAYSWRSLLGRWLRRHRAAVIVAGVFAVILAVGAAVSVARVVAERDVARTQRTIAERERRAARVSEEREHARANQVTLVQARSALDRDPTASLAWLYTLPLDGPAGGEPGSGPGGSPGGFDELGASPGLEDQLSEVWNSARVIAMEARRLGVARHVFRTASTGMIGFDLRGASLITGSFDGTLALWDLASGRGGALSGHRDSEMDFGMPMIWSLARSPDGRFLATASNDRTVRLWRIDGLPGGEEGAAGRPGHLDEVMRLDVAATVVAFSPDGRRLAIATQGDAVQLMTVPENLEQDRDRNRDRDRTPTRELPGHGARVTTLTYSPDGSILATGAGDGTVRLWSSDTGALLHTVSGHRADILDLAFAPDGDLLASTSDDRTIRLIAVGSGQELAVRRHDAEHYGVRFSPDGRLLAVAGGDGRVRIWSLDRPDAPGVLALSGHSGKVFAVAFSPDGRYLASAGTVGEIRLWRIDESARVTESGGSEPATGDDHGFALGHRVFTEARVFRGHTEAIFQLGFSDDGQYLVSTSQDSSARVWRMPREIDELRHHSTLPHTSAVTFTPDGASVVSSHADGSVHLWNLDSGRRLALPPFTRRAADVTVSPDGRYIASASFDGQVRLFDRRGAKDRPASRDLGRHDAPARHVRFSPDGRHLASVSFDDTARLWSLEHGDREPMILRGHQDDVVHLAFLPDSSALVTGSLDHTVRLWRVADGDSRVLMRHDGPVHHVAVSRDGRRVFSASNDHQVRQHDLESGGIEVFAGHERAVNMVEPSPDDRYLVSLGGDSHAVVRQLDSGRSWTLRGHREYLDYMAFSPDGERLVTVSRDSTARLWRLDDGAGDVLARFRHFARTAAFSPDGRRLAIGTQDGRIHLWIDDGPRDPRATRQWLGELTSFRVADQPSPDSPASQENRATTPRGTP